MPGSLLTHAASEPAAARTRSWRVLPLSIAAHAAAGAAALIIPLAAEVELPVPARPSHAYIDVLAVHAPAPPPPPVDSRMSRTSRTSAAPIAASRGIDPEAARTSAATGTSADTGVEGAPGVESGVDLGQLGAPSIVVVAPPPPAQQAPIRVGSRIREPRKIFDVAPIYPPLAVAARKEGVVILEAVIDERGHVVRLKVLRSEPLLDAAAISAVERWRYSPTLLNNVPVPVLMTITVKFSLR